MDARFEALEERIDARFDAFKQYVDARFETLEERYRSRFQLLQWMLAFNLALSVAIIFMLFRLIMSNGLTP
jgi:hypothetical protein